LWHPQSNAKRGGDDRSGSASADLACRPCARCRLMSHPKQAAARAAPTHRASRALQLSCVSSTLPWVPERCYHCNAGRGAERAAAVRRVCAAGAARRRARRGRALPGRRVGAGAPAAAPERSGAGRPRRGPRYERRERRSRHRALAAAGALAGPTPGGATPPPGAPLAPEPSYASWVCYELSGSLAIRCEVAVHATELE